MLQKMLMGLFTLLDGSNLKALCLSRWGKILCALILGVTATLGYAPFELWPVTVGTLVMLMLLLMGLKTRRAVFVTVLCYFIAMNASSLSWLNFVMEGFGGMSAPVAWFVVLVFSCYLGLHYAFFATLAFRFGGQSRAAFIFFYLPAAFAAADFTVGFLLTGFPWMYFGNIAIRGPFATFLPLIGARGTSLLIVFTAASVAMAASRRYLFLPAAGVIIFVGVLFSGISYTTQGSETRVAMVQGNIPQEVRFNPMAASQSVAVYWSNTRALLEDHELVIWPEAALPFYMNDALSLIRDLDTAAKTSHTTLITGILRLDDHGAMNSILALGDTGIDGMQVYDKRKLVPFGEFVPLDALLRPLGKIFNIPLSNFTWPAAPAAPIQSGSLKLIPAICYEAIFPETVAATDSEEAGAILMVSNDAWFGNTRGPLEHFNIARIRAMELQKPMLRATNNGITAIIDAFGKVEEMVPRDAEIVLDGKLTARLGQTPYSKSGPWFTLILMLLLIAGGITAGRIKSDPITESFKDLVRP